MRRRKGGKIEGRRENAGTIRKFPRGDFRG